MRNEAMPRAFNSAGVNLSVITQGFTDGYYQQPWQEHRDPAISYNYELARQIGVLCRVRCIPVPARITFEWASGIIRQDEKICLTYDMPQTFSKAQRPPHLVKADLHISLQAAGLESLSTPQEVHY
jgi:hypothetical protein